MTDELIPTSGESELPPPIDQEQSLGASTSRFVFTPPIDIYESDEGLVLHADLPGVSIESLELQVQNNKLTLFGRVQPAVPEEAAIRYREYQVGDFLRSFILSDEVDHENIAASLQNGVLKVVLPRAKKTLARKIQIKEE
ncbi:Hsp20/alpha crystallin family protein [Calycomorphotria hydatis]|uniref:Spore protein SP21 n=1 Tax=Calycomorphotria hydatis TaxID=2528027 RepID=A0A517T9N9_9PLAN|nr:Hsp20/alpha crystallin family protein [Calycomorphotria hydatis]QDT65087.1 Spore protein SP21 [Calycomorphotria hydatis]